MNFKYKMPVCIMYLMLREIISMQCVYCHTKKKKKQYEKILCSGKKIVQMHASLDWSCKGYKNFINWNSWKICQELGPWLQSYITQWRPCWKKKICVKSQLLQNELLTDSFITTRTCLSVKNICVHCSTWWTIHRTLSMTHSKALSPSDVLSS